MAKSNGHNGHRINGKICDKCGRPYYRSSMVRVWPQQNPGHREGWVRVIQKLCTRCYKGGDAASLLYSMNPKWKPLKNMERITGFTVPKKKEARS